MNCGTSDHLPAILSFYYTYYKFVVILLISIYRKVKLSKEYRKTKDLIESFILQLHYIATPRWKEEIPIFLDSLHFHHVLCNLHLFGGGISNKTARPNYMLTTHVYIHRNVSLKKSWRAERINKLM